MPGAVSSVIYPHSDGHQFDMDYYLKTHMPLVDKQWGPFGLKSWSIAELDKTSGYSVQAILHWDSVEAFQTASNSEATKVVLGDIPKFTNEKPLIIFGAVIKTSQE